MQNAPGDQIVALSGRKAAHLRLEYTSPSAANINSSPALRQQRAGSPRRTGQRNILIEQNRHAVEDRAGCATDRF
jgi:hypothetical protein